MKNPCILTNLKNCNTEEDSTMNSVPYLSFCLDTCLSVQPTRREYRGQRSVDAFSKFLKEQMKNQVTEFHTLSDLNVDVSILVFCEHFAVT